MTKDSLSETAALRALLSETSDTHLLAEMLGFVAVTACPHVGLLASKLGGKASTNLGAPHRGQ